ncbi:TetR/AcrR family transcriptional regulator [Bacillales bacterium AN1005]
MNRLGAIIEMSSRKESLLETALTLFIEHGFANTTIQMILDHSGVSKGTFYKFFDSKEDCLYAILNQRMQEDLLIRKQLEDRHYNAEFDLLVDQIAIPMSLPDKERVWELYWSGFYSGEINSANLATMQLKWLSSRFVEVYGQEISLYASEGAILCYGMLHQIANASRSLHTKKPDWNEVVPKVLTYIEVILRKMQQKNEHIFDYTSLASLHEDRSTNHNLVHLEVWLEEFEEFNRRIQKSNESLKLKQLSTGLLTLLQEKDELNVSVIEVVLKAFHSEHKSSDVQSEANRFIESCWWYIEQIRQ